MEEETLLKNGGKKQRISGGFSDDIPVTTNTGGNDGGGGGCVSSTTHGIDRLSSLPNPLLIGILSLLSIENAAATSALSHRWRHLWTHHPNLEFDSRFFLQSVDFFATVDHILRQFTSPDNIKIFSLEFHESKNDQAQIPNTFLEKWVPLICARNVEEIEVSLHFSKKIAPLKLPTCVFRCKSLVKLTLSGKVYCELPDDGVLALDNLKELDISYVKMDIGLVTKLCKESCTKLETLSLNLDKLVSKNKENEVIVVDIVGDCLKSLSLWGLSNRIKYVIDAPGLEVISVRGPLVAYCFVRTPIGLLKADFRSDFALTGDDHEVGLLGFFGGISSARKMYVLGDLNAFKSIKYVSDDDARSIFPNLAELGVSGIDDRLDLEDAPLLTSLLSKLKKVSVQDLHGCDNEIKFVEYILEHANVLEELYVSITNYDELDTDELESHQLWREYNFSRQLFLLSKSSPACRVEFYGDYIRALSDGLKDGLLNSEINILGPKLWRDGDYYEDEDEDDV